MSIGATIDELYELREKKRSLEKLIEDISKQMLEMESKLIDLMDSQGVQKSTGMKASVSVSENVKPSVEDWDTFYKYIHRTKFYHLLERRPSVTGCRELLETKGKIPGVVPFVQRKLNLRTLKD